MKMKLKMIILRNKLYSILINNKNKYLKFILIYGTKTWLIQI